MINRMIDKIILNQAVSNLIKTCKLKNIEKTYETLIIEINQYYINQHKNFISKFTENHTI